MKTVLITGVGTGIGKQTCLKFLQEGYSVVGVLRNQTHVKALINEASSFARKLHLVFADLEDPDFVTKVMSQLVSFKIDRLEGLINIAGVLNTSTFDQYALNDMEKVMRINFSNPSLLIAKTFPLLKPQKGNVVNITSMSGYQGSVRFPGLGIYGASKAALSSISESLACEFLEHKMHINSLAIGSVNTQMLRNAFPDFQAAISATDMAHYIFNFATHGYQFHNGKTLSVAITNP